jgi:hypothetical protein
LLQDEGRDVMSVPAGCQPLADEIDRLEQELQTARQGVADLDGDEKWREIQEIGRLSGVIEEKKRELQECIFRNVPGYETEVVVFDLAGATSLPYVGRIWSLPTRAVQRELEVATLQGTRVSFRTAGSIPGATIAISIHDASSSPSTGPLFRSGFLASLPPGAPADPAGLVEIGVPAPPSVAITQAMIDASLPAVPFQMPGADPPTTVTGLTVTLGSPGAGSATLAITATVTPGFPIIGNVPVSYTLTFGVAPSMNLGNTSEVCVVTAPTPGTLSSPVVSVLPILAPILLSAEPQLRQLVVRTIETIINTTILALAAGAVGLTALPSGVVVSMRRVGIGPAVMLLFPALGAYGGLLNKIRFP